MSPIALPLFSALVAGCVHALEADHMAAVTTFVTRRPDPLRALGFGVRWGLGHSLALLLVGGALIALDLSPPESAVRVLEGAVGAMLVGLGIWVLRDSWWSSRARTFGGESGETAAVSAHSHGTTWVGAAHGVAGTAGFLALLPATLLASPWLAGAYLASFGVGTMLAMGIYALAAGLLLRRAECGVPAMGRALRIAAGFGSALVGCLWIIRATG